MPKRQSTAAKKARQRQAEAGEKYTKALRAQGPGLVRFRAFSAEGAGWAPIIERAGHRLKEVWPEFPGSCWGEKFGELRWERRGVPFDAVPREAWRVVNEAVRESSVTCQTCPSPGRKRVVYTWDKEYGWVMPWVKTCCDACYHLPDGARENWDYRHLAERYEEPEPEPDDDFACCEALEEVVSAVRAQFDQGGMSALLAKLAELRGSMWSRSAHYDVFSGHAVVLAAEQACAPLLYRVREAGVWSEPLLPEAEQRKVGQAIDGLLEMLWSIEAEEFRG
ncbi:hypothetical protein [Streptomyces sp. NPDC005209]|uniref:hypothetical protein n=1 Tax=Streptomyces sp. NPDC005209 TaxID=3156715 RepID=UPI0033ACDC72